MFLIIADLPSFGERGKTRRTYMNKRDQLTLTEDRKEAMEFASYDAADQHMQRVRSYGPGFANELKVEEENVSAIAPSGVAT